jgi:hypothetical protein
MVSARPLFLGPDWEWISVLVEMLYISSKYLQFFDLTFKVSLATSCLKCTIVGSGFYVLRLFSQAHASILTHQQAGLTKKKTRVASTPRLEYRFNK